MVFWFFFLYAAGPISTLAASIQPNDHEALLKLRSNFDDSSMFSSWDQTDCNTMDYITCTDFGFLSKLELTGSVVGQNVSGSIGDSIGMFPLLESVTMSNMSLQGDLPSALCNLTGLNTLDLSHNQLNGSIPSCFGSMKNLSYLTLEDNALHGDISLFLCSLTDIKYLNLGSNLRLTGSIPECVGNMTGLRQLLLSGTGLLGVIPKDLCRLTSLKELVIEAKLEGTIPPCLGNLHALTSLSFGLNNLEGPIPPELCNLTSIESLVLEHNRLSGGIPSCLSKSPNLTKLALGTNNLVGPLPGNFSNPWVLIFLDENYLSGSPEVTFAGGGAPSKCPKFMFGNCFAYSPQCNDSAPAKQRSPAECAAFCNATAAAGPCGGHGRCFFSDADAACACDAGFVAAAGAGAAATCVPAPPPPPPGSSSSSSGSSSSTGVIVGVVVGILCLLALLGLALVWYLRKKRRHRDEMKDRLYGAKSSAQLLAKLEEQSVRVIGLDDIQAATDGFSEEKLLGKGGYGSVYLGNRDGTPAWAVKRATRANMETLAVFEDEVVLISKINHRNLVQLLGFCTEGDEQILVYEYVPCGTLQDRLQPSPGSGAAPLSWAQRLDVAVGVARGLNYLHSFSQKPIVHRDIKSANILLDKDMQPKIADFGLSKVLAAKVSIDGGADDAMVLSSIAGTFGYMDPELQRNLEVTPKLDVFSFGVVLLELLTGKPALMKDPSSHEPTTLYKWATPYINSGNVEAIVDPYLLASSPTEALHHFAAVARLCLLRPAADRPSMAHVTLTLEGARGHTYVEPAYSSRQGNNDDYFKDRQDLGSTSSYSGKAPHTSVGPR